MPATQPEQHGIERTWKRFRAEVSRTSRSVAKESVIARSIVWFSRCGNQGVVELELRACVCVCDT